MSLVTSSVLSAVDLNCQMAAVFWAFVSGLWKTSHVIKKNGGRVWAGKHNYA